MQSTCLGGIEFAVLSCVGERSSTKDRKRKELVMAGTMQSTIVGVFENTSSAQAAIRDLKALGLRDDQVGMIMRSTEHSTGHVEKAGDSGTMAAEGAAVGAATGAGVGALWALGIAANVLPAIGPIVAGGILASVLASAAGGAATAGLLGALVGLGFSEEEASYYEGEVKSGRCLVTVRAPERASEVSSILARHGAYDIHNRGSADTLRR
jgi:hypothetical protein